MEQFSMDIDDSKAQEKIALIERSVTYREDHNDNLFWNIHWATPLPLPAIIVDPASTNTYMLILAWVVFFIIVGFSGKSPLKFLFMIYMRLLPNKLPAKRLADRRNEREF